MTALTQLKRHLRPGQVYRRKDLARWSNAVDRHVRRLVEEGRLEKVSAGVYMTPRQTRFGAAPAKTEKMIEAFLGDERFLLVSPNAFNGLGVGTTQPHNEPVVYNHRRRRKGKPSRASPAESVVPPVRFSGGPKRQRHKHPGWPMPCRVRLSVLRQRRKEYSATERRPHR